MSDKQSAKPNTHLDHLTEDEAKREHAKAVHDERISDNVDDKFIIYITSDKMKCLLSAKRSVESPNFFLEVIAKALASVGVEYGIHTKQLIGAINKLNEEGGNVEYGIVAEGKNPINGENGFVEIAKELDPEERQKSDSDTVDYRAESKVLTVKVDQVIAHLRPPTKGTVGCNIKKEVVPQRPGVPATIKNGKNIYVAENGVDIISKIEGSPHINDDEVFVAPELNINGDVDHSTGSIDFYGDVNIKGNVLDGFFVKATGDITINGAVDGCNIFSKKDITINGGITGHEHAVIRGRTIKARHVQEATIIASSNIILQKECMNSTVKTLGKLIIENGRLVAGNLTALRGFDVQELGSDLGVKTLVTIGENFKISDKLESLKEKSDEISERLKKLIDTFEKNMEPPEKYATLPAEKQQKLQEELLEFRTLRLDYADILKTKNFLTEKLKEERKDTFTARIKKLLNTGVVANTRLCSLSVKTKLKGPMLLKEDVESGTLRVTN